jgi:hypothetical protein
MKVRITHIDGKLPNLALMAISAYHKNRGDEVYFTRDVERTLFEPQEYDRVYGSVIFKFARHRAERLRKSFPHAIIGGTGLMTDEDSKLVSIGKLKSEDIPQEMVEKYIGDIADLDYSIYPEFTGSIGFTQRGCRLRCGFCVVPQKEGKNLSVGTINDIWRGEGHPKHIHLLDNDFFGQDPVKWVMRSQEMIQGKFKVCFTQGINVRLINPAACVALRNIDYRDDSFKVKRLHTAWDSLGDEKIFFRGVDMLEEYGIPPKHLMAYMLIGHDPSENWDRIWHRFNRMVEREIKPYPMVFDRTRTDLLCFQRWVLTGIYRFVKWDEYKRSTKSEESMAAYEREVAKSK